MPKNNLPYVNAYKDRTGKMRYYLRRPGVRRVALSGRPGTREFAQSYAAATAAPAKPNKVRPTKRTGRVYYAMMGDLIKIGFTSNMKQRERTYRTHTGGAIQILASEAGTMHDEKRMHRMFSDFRVHREWFRPNRALLDHIQNLTVPNESAD